MKNSYIFITFLLMSFSLGAAESCPLENVKYRPLRESVSILLKNVQLAPGCEAQAGALQDASQNLSDIITDNDEPATTSNDVDRTTQLTQTTGAAINQTTTAINSISSINNVLRGKCGKKLMNTFDYMEALTDTVVGLGPLLLLSEGNTSLVLYTTIAGQIIKGLIDFLRGNKIDMAKQETREQFIKNSCAFYSLNNKIRALLYTLNTQTERLDEKLEIQKQLLSELQEQEPVAPQHQILNSEKQFKLQLVEFNRFKAMLGKISSKNFICLTVKRSINKGFGQDIVSMLESLLDNSEDAADIRTFTKFFKTEINSADLYSGEKCDEQAQDWIAAINDLQNITAEIIKQNVKELENFEPYKIFREWEKDVATVTNSIQKLESQKLSLVDMTSNGHHVDLSEILDNRDTIKLALFENKSRRSKGAAHSWLEYKVEQSHKSLQLFIKKRKEFNRELKQVELKALNNYEKNEFCAQAETLWDSWTTASSHIGAANTFCSVFKQVIQKSEFSDTYSYCYAVKSVKPCTPTIFNEDDDDSDYYPFTQNCNKSKNVNSVKAQQAEIKKYESTIINIRQTLEQLSCEAPDLYTL